jgi:hypothetical protein
MNNTTDDKEDIRHRIAHRIRSWQAGVGVWRLSVTHFLMALVLLLVTLPLVLDLPHGKIVEAGLFTVVFLSAVLAVGGRRLTLVIAGLLVIPAVAGVWHDHITLGFLPREVSIAAAIVFSAFIILNLLRFTLAAPRVDSQVLCAGISIYLMMAILWAFAYALAARLVPNAFKLTVGPGPDRPLAGFEALYFSFSTLTTLGYGDIVPTAPVTRQLAILEATTGTIFVTVLIARLVSLYSAGDQARSAPPSEDVPHKGD